MRENIFQIVTDKSGSVVMHVVVMLLISVMSYEIRRVELNMVVTVG